MTKPTVRIHDLSTDEVVDREMTDAEFAEYEVNKIKEAELVAQVQAAKAAAEAKLAALGLTTDDLKALGL